MPRSRRSAIVGGVTERYDVIIIGAGAGGGVFQKTLGLNDFYLAGNGRPPLGNIQMLGKSNAMAMKGRRAPLERLR
jgi:hypothetical protein